MQKKLVIKNRVFGEGKPLVCVPVMERDETGILSLVKQMVTAGVDMIEWRVDAFDQADNLNAIRKVLEELKPLVKETVLVYTFRSRNQGGQKAFSPEMIRDIHEVAAESGVADLIDLELLEGKHPDKEIRTLQKMGAHVIASHHDFHETPDGKVIQMLLSKLHQSGADIVKLAVMPQSTMDVLTLLTETARFHAEYPQCPLITMSMGPMGGISRVSGEVFGSCVTFGAFCGASAPGQLPVGALSQVLDILHESMEA